MFLVIAVLIRGQRRRADAVLEKEGRFCLQVEEFRWFPMCNYTGCA